MNLTATQATEQAARIAACNARVQAMWAAGVTVADWDDDGEDEWRDMQDDDVTVGPYVPCPRGI